MAASKQEAPLRDRAQVQVQITVTRNRKTGYSSEEALATIDLTDAIALVRGEGDVEENSLTFKELLSHVVAAAKGTVEVQIDEQIKVLSEAREKREAKERAREELEED